eukprot:scaffold25021_cov61-Phaeocystis_antarctica.AAC.2
MVILAVHGGGSGGSIAVTRSSPRAPPPSDGCPRARCRVPQAGHTGAAARARLCCRGGDRNSNITLAAGIITLTPDEQHVS